MQHPPISGFIYLLLFFLLVSGFRVYKMKDINVNLVELL